MDLDLTDRTFLVTAASRGLGFSVAKSLADEGAEVLICGRNEDSLKKATDILGERFVADVSKQEDIKRLVKDIGSQMLHIDGLFVNAGGPPPGTFSDLSDDDWRKAIDLTLMSAVWLTRETRHLLKMSDSPSILYSTSISVKQPINNLLYFFQMQFVQQLLV
ncbi:MAG: SDR family NAD(P)-dependent oxidoreductase [Candidatus Thorarchaeota archaeon]|jgi:3-oxoacyl-[acyl-carrier protein] reductase